MISICVYIDFLSTMCALIIIITRNLYCAAKCRSKLRGAGHCTSAKCMTSVLRHVAEAFPPAREETILNSLVLIIGTNTSMVLNCALTSDLHKDDSRCRTAGCSFNVIPRTHLLYHLTLYCLC